MCWQKILDWFNRRSGSGGPAGNATSTTNSPSANATSGAASGPETTPTPNDGPSSGTPPAGTVVPPPDDGTMELYLTHPEESPDYTRNLQNVDLAAALDAWCQAYDVPPEHREFWKTGVRTTLDETLTDPAVSDWDDGIRYIKIKPAWANPGVIAHEQAHNSYAYLTDAEKAAFPAEDHPYRDGDPLVTYLWSVNGYGLVNDVEGHAEMYRYLGDRLPEALKKYYPKLF